MKKEEEKHSVKDPFLHPLRRDTNKQDLKETSLLNKEGSINRQHQRAIRCMYSAQYMTTVTRTTAVADSRVVPQLQFSIE